MSLLDRLRRALAIGHAEPRDTLLERALQLHESGDLAGACALYAQLLQRNPVDADALHLTGLAAHQRGNHAEALRLITQAITLSPASQRYHFNRGNVLAALDRTADALASFRQATELDPSHAPSWFNLGGAQSREEDYAGALDSLRRAFSLGPQLPGLRMALAQALANQAGRSAHPQPLYVEASALLETHWQESPDPVEARLLLAYALQQSRAWTAAASHYQVLLQADPNLEPAHNNLANCYNQLGRVRDAIPHYREVARLAPTNALAGSSVIACLNYDETLTPQALFDEHRAWAARFAPVPIAPSIRPRHHTRQRLRIAYVSPDLRRHPVATLFTPIIERHDRNRFELYCYYNYPSEDVVSHRIRAACDRWHDIHTISDVQFASQLASDEPDILVDLSGHTSYGRLPAYAAKPAPVQVSWLGYFNSTGMPQMDAFISDVHSSPAGQDIFFTEQLIRLPDTRFTFEPHEFYPEPNDLPARAPGAVTFGSLHTLAKINDAVLKTWGDLLRRLPEARLLFQASALEDAPNRETFMRRCEAAGIGRQRIEIRPWARLEDSARTYHDIDILLDPFPFCGGMTSFDALWMGVPIITLAGTLIAGRQTTSMLANLGLGDLAATDIDGYLSAATLLANDIPRLRSLRQSLRARVAASALCDHDTFTRHLESVYLDLWKAKHGG